MGTNYYLHEKPPCPTCGHAAEPYHIGKSSAGWCFALHVDPDNGVNDLPDLERRWSAPGAVIKNEYGELILPERMRTEILERKWPHSEVPSRKFLNENEAECGPNRLLRHQIMPGHCIGHGDGTYDLCVGEFS